MCHPVWAAAFMSLCAVGGCAPTTASSARKETMIGPHGGFAVRLPDDIGFGEVVVELATTERSEEPHAQVVVYFLSSDLKTALSPLPTDVSVKLLLPYKDPQTLALSSQPKPDDPAGTGRFASQLEPPLLDEPIGELTAAVAGKSFTAPFSTVR